MVLKAFFPFIMFVLVVLAFVTHENEIPMFDNPMWVEYLKKKLRKQQACLILNSKKNSKISSTSQEFTFILPNFYVKTDIRSCKTEQDETGCIKSKNEFHCVQ